MHHVWGLVSPFNKMAVVSFTECLCQKNQTFIARCCRCDRHTCVQCCQASTDHCGVSLGTMGSCWHKRHFQTARGLDHCDVIASVAPRAEQSCIIMGRQGCEGVVHPAPSIAGREISSKSPLRSGFDCIILHIPSGAGRATSSQPSHCLLNIVNWDNWNGV